MCFNVVKIRLVCQPHRVVVRYRLVVVDSADGVIHRKPASKMLDDVVHAVGCDKGFTCDKNKHLMEFRGCVDDGHGGGFNEGDS